MEGPTVLDQRRHPDPIEWALLVDKVARMGAAIETLTEEVKKVQTGKCTTCAVSHGMDRAVADHETRMRRIEEFVYKGVAIAAVGAPFLYFVLNKIWQ